MGYRLIIIASIFLALTGCNLKNYQSVYRHNTIFHSMVSELKENFDVANLPVYFDSTICGQVSTYDTTGGNDDGFSGKYSFIRKDKKGGLLLFDATGPGVINRIWTPTPQPDTLDFFIDDTLKPSFSIFYPDLFSGKIYPFSEPLCGNQLGGFYCYLPIPFSKSCRIVSRGSLEQFHQIGYRLYKKGSTVKSFNISLSEEEKNELQKIKLLWLSENRKVKDFYGGPVKKSGKQVEISPGQSTTIFESSAGGRILGIELTPASLLAGLSKNIDIRITWDDETTPSVYCPAADFFGFAFGEPSMQSLLLGSGKDTAYSYIPMPFDKSARIELICRAKPDKQTLPSVMNVQVWYSDKKRDQLEEGKFRAIWKSEDPVPSGHPLTIADIQGKGHYIGTILQAQGLKAGMTIFFEGDDSTAIDGIFRMHGTGSEDYFNGGWYAMMDRWDGRMSLPLHGCLGYSLPFCRTGGYRFYLSDKMSFSKSLYLGIEHGPQGNMVPAAYTSLGLCYTDTPPGGSGLPENSKTSVFQPDTLFIYPQLTDFTIYGKINIATTWKYGTGGESYILEPGAESWLRMSLSDIPDGSYALYLDIVRSAAGCDFSVWRRQKQISDWIPSFSRTETREPYVYAADYNVTEENKTITLRFKPKDVKNSVILNRIVLIRRK